VALSKIQAESMNLADTYAFTGSVSGAGDANDMVLLQATTITSNVSSVEYTGISTTYPVYKIIGQGIRVNQTDSIGIRIGTSSGYLTSGYDATGFSYRVTAGSGSFIGNTGMSRLAISGYHLNQDTGTSGANFEVTCYNLTASRNKAFHATNAYTQSTDNELGGDTIVGLQASSSIITKVEVMTGGSAVIETGTVSFYGVK